MEYDFKSPANMLASMKTIPNHIADEAARLKQCYERWKQVAPKDRTQAVLAEELGWQSQGTVSQYMTGRLELNLEALLRFASVLAFNPREVSPRLVDEYFSNGFVSKGTMDIIEGELQQAPPKASRRLPVIGSVQAGSFCEANDLFEPGDAEEWMDSYGPAGPHAFILKVEGFSMDPDFRPGDKVVIDPDAQWSAGDFVIAKRASDQAVTLKQIRCEGEHYYLFATNPAWPDRIIRMDEEWHICGRVRRKIVEY